MTHQKLNKVLALALAVILSVGLLPTQASAASTDFADVPPNHWAYADVMWARSHGVVDGVGNNRFDPDSDVSHAQMIKMLCDAFLSSEYAAFEAAHRTEIEQIFGGASSWYTSKAYYFAQIELLQNVSVVIADPASANAAMNRYDMAQILSNVLSNKDKTATSAQKSAAQAAIGDFSGIPGAYRDAVLTTYALGIINGEGGKFNGGNSMTRAQACAVIHRMDTLLNGSTGNDPTPVTPTVKEIQVSSSAWSGTCPATATQPAGKTAGTRWDVIDNGFSDGYLNNGLPITEENVIELLHEAEKIWPTDMIWAGSAAPTNNNFYGSSGTVSSTIMKTQTTGTAMNLNSNFACGGFTAMISDYLFGRDNNNFHRVTNMNDIRPGDIILEIDTTTNIVSHAMIAVTASGGAYTGLQGTTANYRDGYIHCADGNANTKVSWPNPYSALQNINSYATDIVWQVYSRYPETGSTPAPTPTPGTVPPTVKEIQVSSATWSGNNNSVNGGPTSGNAWTVTDNGFGDGYLNNGKPITEENVIELLNEAQKIWPTGMTWTETGSGNNFYRSSGSVSSLMAKTQATGMGINLNTNFGCGGFAAMISDYLFGRDSNMFHRVTDTTYDIRPGDVIFMIDTTKNKVTHAMIATSASFTEYEGNGTPHPGFVYSADGNNGSKVSWPGKYDSGCSEETTGYTWQVYSRYPA